MGFFDKFSGGMGFNSNENFEYYAVIEKSGLFFSGEIPDINWSEVNFCDSYDELIAKLTDKLRDEQRRGFSLPRRTSYEQISAKYPGKQIVAITPHGVVGGHSRSFGSQHKFGGGMNPRAESGYEYYAWVEKSALFFSGEIPDINFCKVSLCDSYEELINKLTEKLTEAYQRSRNSMPAKTSYNQMVAKYPGKQIVAILPKF